jgi:hypothetical protein
VSVVYTQLATCRSLPVGLGSGDRVYSLFTAVRGGTCVCVCPPCVPAPVSLAAEAVVELGGAEAGAPRGAGMER